MEEADLVEGTKAGVGARGRCRRHLERAGELDLADAHTGRGDLRPGGRRVFELDRLMAGVEAEPQMTVDDRRIDAPPAYRRAKVLVEERDRLVARLDDAIGLGLETDPNVATMPLREPIEIDGQMRQDGRAVFRARRRGRGRIGQWQRRDRPLRDVGREQLAEDVREVERIAMAPDVGPVTSSLTRSA